VLQREKEMRKMLSIAFVALILITIVLLMLTGKLKLFYLSGQPSVWYLTANSHPLGSDYFLLSETQDESHSMITIDTLSKYYTLRLYTNIYERTKDGARKVIYYRAGEVSVPISAGEYTLSSSQAIPSYVFSIGGELELELLYEYGTTQKTISRTWLTDDLNAIFLNETVWRFYYTVSVSEGTDYCVYTLLVGGNSLTRVENVVLMEVQPPKASFTLDPPKPTVTLPVTFDASESEGLTALTYIWDFGDGNITSTTSPTIIHIYQSTGDVLVTLTVRDAYGQTDSTSQKITVYPIAIIEFHSEYKPNFYDNLSITFDGSKSSAGTGAEIVDWYWEFGDGETSKGEIVSHIYTKAGTYTVKLTVTDSYGKTDDDVKVITIIESPKADISYNPLSPKVFERVTFTATNVKGDIISYSWEIDESVVKYGQSITHIFEDFGTHSITLTVSDGVLASIITLKLYIQDIPPEIQIIDPPDKILPADSQVNMSVKVTKSGNPVRTGNLCLELKGNETTYESVESVIVEGYAYFSLSTPAPGTYTAEFKYGNFTIDDILTILPRVTFVLEYSNQQFYNIMGENDFYLTAVLFDPYTYEPILDYSTNVQLKVDNLSIPYNIHAEENRLTITAKVFKVFNDTKKRVVEADVIIIAKSYYDTTLSVTVEMIPPIVDYWLCSTSGSPLPMNLRKGTEGFVIKLVKPDYVNVTEENIYLEIRTPTEILTSDDLTLIKISDNEIVVNHTFDEEGVYELTISVVGLPVPVPTRKYILTVQSGFMFDISAYLQYAFMLVITLAVIYLMLRSRKK